MGQALLQTAWHWVKKSSVHTPYDSASSSLVTTQGKRKQVPCWLAQDCSQGPHAAQCQLVVRECGVPNVASASLWLHVPSVLLTLVHKLTVVHVQ